MAFNIPSVFVYAALGLLALYSANAFTLFKPPQAKSPIVSLSWSNCGPATDPIQVKTIDVSPDPIRVPGNVTADGSVAVTAALPTDITISLTMEKKVAGFYIKVPCVDNVGSCNYGDICKDWADFCPKYMANFSIPCACPIPANTYSIPASVFDITGKLPAAASGDYRVSADIGSSEGHLGCVKVEANIQPA